MKSLVLFWVFLIFPLTNSFGQERKVDIPVYGAGDTSFYYGMLKNQMNQMGLKDLRYSQDSINFRFWTGYQLVDLTIPKDGNIIGNTFTFSVVVPNKRSAIDYQKVKYRFLKEPIHPDTAAIVINKLLNEGIHKYPDDSKIPGYKQGFDGYSYITEFSSDSIYKFASYWAPGTQTESIKEAKQLTEFYFYMSNLLRLPDRFQRFNGTVGRTKRPGPKFWINKFYWNILR